MKASRKNFTMIPNLIDELQLTPIADALYRHVARWDGAPLKTRPSMGVRALTKRFGVGDLAIKEAKKELLKHGLISIESQPEKGIPDQIHIVDIWARNDEFFAPVSIQGQVKDLPLSSDRSSQTCPQSEAGLSLSGDSVNKTLKKLSEKDIEITQMNDMGGVIWDAEKAKAEGDRRREEIRQAAIKDLHKKYSPISAR